MSVAELSLTTRTVKKQYETLPYPPRDPADEKKRLLRTGLDELPVVNHYCFGGRRDFRKGFRVLVAGGGTGDAVVFLAQQLRKTNAAIVYLDLSQASMEVAQQRARARGLQDRISWNLGSLLDVPQFGWEPFDLINCSGVLHHLADPPAGLAALRSVLKDGGAMGLMVYGQYGRTGLYQFQDLMRLVNNGQEDVEAKLENTKRIIKTISPTNWFARGVKLSEGFLENDVEIYDMFLHSQDRAYTVPQLYEFVENADLHLVEFSRSERTLYNARSTFADRGILAGVEKLPKRRQQAAAELFWGVIKKHEFWVSTRPDSIADPSDPENVPYFTWPAGQIELQKSVKTSQGNLWKMEEARPDGITLAYQLKLNDASRRFVELIDGRRTMGAIVQIIASEQQPAMTAGEARRKCITAFESLRAFDLVVLRHVSVPLVGNV